MTDLAREQRRKHRIWDPVARAMMTLALALLISFAVVAFLLWRESNLPVLDHVDPQIVLSRVDGVAVPAATLGDGEVEVQAVKCNRTGEPLSARVSISWTTLDPRGTVIGPVSSVSTYEPGCATVTFLNPFPVQVVLRTREILRDDPERGYVEWVITGTEKAIDKRLAPEESWRTQPFRIYGEESSRDQ